MSNKAERLVSFVWRLIVKPVFDSELATISRIDHRFLSQFRSLIDGAVLKPLNNDLDTSSRPSR